MLNLRACNLSNQIFSQRLTPEKAPFRRRCSSPECFNFFGEQGWAITAKGGTPKENKWGYQPLILTSWNVLVDF